MCVGSPHDVAASPLNVKSYSSSCYHMYLETLNCSSILTREFSKAVNVVVTGCRTAQGTVCWGLASAQRPHRLLMRLFPGIQRTGLTRMGCELLTRLQRLSHHSSRLPSKTCSRGLDSCQPRSSSSSNISRLSFLWLLAMCSKLMTSSNSIWMAQSVPSPCKAHSHSNSSGSRSI